MLKTFDSWNKWQLFSEKFRRTFGCSYFIRTKLPLLRSFLKGHEICFLILCLPVCAMLYKFHVLSQRSLFKLRTPWEWIQLWAIGRNLPDDALEPSSYSAFSSWLCWSGNFSEADYSSSSINNKQCACKTDDSLISGKLSQSRNKQQISRQFHFSKRREDEIPHESETYRRTWLQLQKCVGVLKTHFTGSIRWVRKSIVSFSTSARAWKFRCNSERQHIVIHWSSSKRIWAILRNWAQLDIGYRFGGKKCSMHVLRMYDSATSNRRLDGSRRQQLRFAAFFCFWWGHKYWYIIFVKICFWDKRFSKFKPVYLIVFFEGQLLKLCESNILVPKNTTSKNAFLAVSLYVDKTLDLKEINSRAPFGGKIGAGDSLLHNYLRFSEVLRMHAVFHDAYGYMRSVNNVGPGLCLYLY